MTVTEFTKSAAPATGYFERVDWHAGRLSVGGWMLAPSHPIKAIHVLVNGAPTIEVAPSVRRDVERAWGWIRHASESGFSFEVESTEPRGRVDLFGESEGRVLCRMGSFFAADRASLRPTPPPSLSQRATLASGEFLRLQGLRIFTDLHDQIARFRELREGLPLLEWGCGSGRTAAHFISILKARVFGVDIDAEAVAWCNRQLPEGVFGVVGSYPPLPFPDRSFDVAVACSVFTHLSPNHQREWLRELHRVLRPDGILLATTHGEFAYVQALHRPGRSLTKRLLGAFASKTLNGFVDHGVDHSFDGIAPSGYYRNVYQSRAHTLADWTERFEALDYIERGVDGFQDLAVLRPFPPSPLAST